MKKHGVLNDEVSRVISCMGHFDQLTICDAGLPVPLAVQRIDLAVKENLPRFLDVVSVVAEELEVQRIFLAEEAKERNAEMVSEIQKIFPDADVVFISHDVFKQQTNSSRAVIRTGECSPYSNVILESGVIF